MINCNSNSHALSWCISWNARFNHDHIIMFKCFILAMMMKVIATSHLCQLYEMIQAYGQHKLVFGQDLGGIQGIDPWVIFVDFLKFWISLGYFLRSDITLAEEIILDSSNKWNQLLDSIHVRFLSWNTWSGWRDLHSSQFAQQFRLNGTTVHYVQYEYENI